MTNQIIILLYKYIYLLYKKIFQIVNCYMISNNFFLQVCMNVNAKIFYRSETLVIYLISFVFTMSV